MARRNFYLLCVLPALEPFGSAPPVSKQKLTSLVTESEGPADIVQTLLLSDDLLQREAVLAGEIKPDQADIGTLSLSQLEHEQSLPGFLVPEQDDEHEASGEAIAVDLIWQRYFRYAVKISRKARSRFLAAWVGYEVGLRNAMVTARAEALKLDPNPYMVAPELADPDISFEATLAEWSDAPNPLAAIEVLDRSRWSWLLEEERWYCFSDDEVAAYTAKFLLLNRWRRISETNRKSVVPKDHR